MVGNHGRRDHTGGEESPGESYFSTMNLAKAFLFLGLVLALASCNVVRMGMRHDTKAMEKAGLHAYTFTDAAGPHYVWSSTKPGSADDGRPKLMLVHGITSQSLMWALNVGPLSVTEAA